MVHFDICQFLATPGPFEYFCQNIEPSENQFFLDEGAATLSRGLGGFRWADGWPIWWYHFQGGATHLGGLVGVLVQKVRFSTHLRQLRGYSALTDFIKHQSIGVH